MTAKEKAGLAGKKPIAKVAHGAPFAIWYHCPLEPGVTAPSTCAFHELLNVGMTPHVSGWTDDMCEVRAKLIDENIRRVAN